MSEKEAGSAFDAFAAEYASLHQKNLGLFGKNMSVFPRHKARLAGRRLAPPKSLLDFGCGIGVNLPYLREVFPDAAFSGCDISEKSLEIAAENAPFASFRAVPSPEQLALAYPKGIDSVFISCVLHHIPPDQHAAWLQAIHRIITPGGGIIIFEHNPFNPITRRMVSTCPYDADAALLSPKYCKSLLAEAGFSRIILKYTLFTLWTSAFWVTLERGLGWLPLGGQYYAVATKKIR